MNVDERGCRAELTSLAEKKKLLTAPGSESAKRLTVRNKCTGMLFQSLCKMFVVSHKKLQLQLAQSVALTACKKVFKPF